MLQSHCQTGKRILFRVLSFLMMILIAVMPIMIPAAQAVVIEALVTKYAVEIIAGILIAGGLVVAGSPEVYQIAQSYYDWVSSTASSIKDTIWGWAKNILDGGLDIAKTAIRVSSGLWQSLMDFLNTKGLADGNFIVSGEFTLTKDDEFFGFCTPRITTASGETWTVSKGRFISGAWSTLYVNFTRVSDGLVRTVSLGKSNVRDDNAVGDMFGIRKPAGDVWLYVFYNLNGYQDLTHIYSGGDELSICKIFGVDFPLTIGADVAIPVSGDLVWPGGDSLVKAPDIPSVETDADGKEVVVVPDLSLNPADHVADIPKDATGEKVDVPYDVIVDTTTGEKVDTDVDNPDKPGEDVKPGEGDITWPDMPAMKLPAMIAKKFPFSIPFDVYNIVSAFVVDPIEPVLSVPLKVPSVGIDYTFSVDLSKYHDVIQIVKWLIYAVSVVGLAAATSKFIKW